jgi:hypothetical protein
VIEFPGASTLELISNAACEVWPALSCVDSDESEVFNWLMPVTVLISASCEVICELSIGLVGSWFCNCVTSSCKKVLCSDAPELAELLAELADELDAEPVAEFALIVSCMRFETVVPLPPIGVVKEVLLRFRW